MKRVVLAITMVLPFVVGGCSSRAGSAGLGALGGAAAGGGAYEYRLHQEQQRIEDDYKAKKIDEKEYQIRKDEVERLRLLK